MTHQEFRCSLALNFGDPIPKGIMVVTHGKISAIDLSRGAKCLRRVLRPKIALHRP